MLTSNIRFAWRSLAKNKNLSIINILGLSIGISAALVIFMIAQYHFSFDKFETGQDRIYRVVSDFEFSNGTYHSPGIHSPMGPAMKKELTGLEAAVRYRLWDQDAKIAIPPGSPGPKTQPTLYTHQKNIVFADGDFFRLLGYRWIAGSAASSLRQPGQAVLSETAAHFYFPHAAAVDLPGRELIFNDSVRMVVTGVVEDLSAQGNTDFSFQLFFSLATLESTTLRPDDWADWNSTDPSSQLLVRLSPGTPPALIEKGVYRLFAKNGEEEGSFKGKWIFSLQPLGDLHFNGTYAAYAVPVSNRPTLYGLVAVGCFLLLLACINFVNLTTAYAARRAKEIGIRKTLGSSRGQLMEQMFGETLLLTLFSAVLALILIPFILKAFAGFIPQELHFSALFQPRVLVFFVILVALVAGLSGFYPAIFLSRFKPVLVLKNQVSAETGQSRNAWLRKTLTTSQFVIAQFLIIAVLLVGRQIRYVLNKDMGFAREAIVYFEVNPRTTTPGRQFALFKKLKEIPGIALVSQSNKTPSSDKNLVSTFRYKDGHAETETHVYIKYADTNYIALYRLRLLAGTNLSPSDTARDLIINQTYMRMLGITDPQKAIGKYIEWNNKRISVVGVVADFNQRSLHEPIKPLALASQTEQEITFSLALQPDQTGGNRATGNTGQWERTLREAAAAYGAIYPGDDFEYHFFDQDIARYYDKEQQVGSLLRWATALTIFISCLGLLGLVMYTTTQRRKEIGVRKILGATVYQILGLICREFLVLVGMAFVIASPLAWFGAHQWLKNFADRAEISWVIFLSGGLVMVVVALLTLSWQTIRTALANPVESLRE